MEEKLVGATSVMSVLQSSVANPSCMLCLSENCLDDEVLNPRLFVVLLCICFVSGRDSCKCASCAHVDDHKTANFEFLHE